MDPAGKSARSRSVREEQKPETEQASTDQVARPPTDPSVLASLSARDIQEALQRILDSDEFSTVTQLRSFLDYVVTCELNGTPEGIKGYTIAVEALGRDADFNPISDPIVRVEAARLRRRLAMYYEGSGRDDQVVIHIPKGSYAPQIRPRSAPSWRTGEAPVVQESSSPRERSSHSGNHSALRAENMRDRPIPAGEPDSSQPRSRSWGRYNPLVLAFSACLIFFAGFIVGRY